MGEKKIIKFYMPTDEFGVFSNFSRHRIFLKNKVWRTVEHYFQAQKFVGKKQEEEIRRSFTPKAAAQIGRDRKNSLRLDWEAVKVGVMKEALIAKFTQHEDLGEILYKTEDALLVEHTAKDKFWGDGGHGRGLNMLGKLLMEVREELKQLQKT
jgi:N-glycosidase YbiA